MTTSASQLPLGWYDPPILVAPAKGWLVLSKFGRGLWVTLGWIGKVVGIALMVVGGIFLVMFVVWLIVGRGTPKVDGNLAPSGGRNMVTTQNYLRRLHR